MKRTTIILSLGALTMLSTGCVKDGIDQDLSFLSTASTANSGRVAEITNDNSGRVTITPTGEGASVYTVKFGHGTGANSEATINAGNNVTHIYPEGAYTITIISKSASGTETSATYPLQVTYRAPENVNITTSQNGRTLKVKASAQYAASYLVYYGDVANEVGTAMATGVELSHTYATAGTYTMKVVALSGGAAKTEKTQSVVIFDAFGLPITFDATTQNPFFGTFGDGQQFAIVANPSKTGLNTSNTVGKFTRGFQMWSGTYSPLEAPIDMTKGKKIKVLVYITDAALIGKQLNVELEAGHSIANGVAILKSPVTAVNVWQELTFDFSTIAVIPATEKFSQLVLRFNDGIDGAGPIIYVDNFTQTN